MSGRLQHPRTMVTCTAGFDRDHCRCQLLEEYEHLLASQLLAQNRLLSGVHSVKLENVFRRIHANSANLFHGRPPLSEIFSDLILAHLMPSGVVHTNRTSSAVRRPCATSPLSHLSPARRCGLTALAAWPSSLRRRTSWASRPMIFLRISSTMPCPTGQMSRWNLPSG